jgi:hypothetical protein
MRKMLLILPVAAVLVAAGVLALTVGGSLAVAAPDTAPAEVVTAATEEAAPAVADGWHETNDRTRPPKKSPLSPARP